NPRGDCPGFVQGPAVQVLPRCGRQRADRADGRNARSDRERRRDGQEPDDALQPGPPGSDHPRARGDHRRRGSAGVMAEYDGFQRGSQIPDGKWSGHETTFDPKRSMAPEARGARVFEDRTHPMATATATGRIAQVIGSTFDAEFEEGHLPEIYNALRIDSEEKGVAIHLTGEVQQHLGGNRVRCVALGSTDGLVRGMEVVDTGGPVSVPVGK